MFYISRYAGAGTKQDPFRPLAFDAVPGCGAVDMRPDPAVADGRALVWSPTAISATGIVALADDRRRALSATVRNRIKNQLGVNFAETNLADIIGMLLVNPPAGKWKAIRAARSRMRHEIWLGAPGDNLFWSKTATLGPQGELIDPTDDFNRANGALSSPWTKAFSFSNVSISSNQITCSSSENRFYYYSGASASADQYAELKAVTFTNQGDYGPAVRVANGSETAYQFTFYAGDGGALYKIVSGSWTLLASSLWGSPDADDRARIEGEGSTLRVYDVTSGSTLLTTQTDSSLSSGNVGFGFYSSGAAADDWAGGDLGAARIPRSPSASFDHAVL